MPPELPILTALLAGAISFLSPCVLPLVPPYLGYMAGVSLDTLAGGGTKADATIGSSAQRRVVLHSLLFVLGFSVVFTALGAGASTIGQWIRAWQDTLAIVAGLLIIVMGLHFLGLFRIGLLYREARFNPQQAGLAGSFLMGLAFAFAGGASAALNAAYAGIGGTSQAVTVSANLRVPIGGR